MIGIRTLVLFSCCFILSMVQGNSQLDSLKSVIANTANNEQRVAAYNALIESIPWETPDSTLKYCELFLSEPDIEKDLSSLGNIYYYLGRGNRSKGEYKTALENFEKSQKVYLSIPDSVNIAKSGYQLGILNLFQGNMEVSLRHLTKSLELYQQVGTQNDIADMYNALASYYSDNDQMEDATKKYKEALAIYSSENDTSGMANVHANLGMTYTQLKQFDLARQHLMKQGRLDSLLNSNWGLGFHYDFMGYMYQEMGDNNLALLWYKRALGIRKLEKSHYNICESNLSIASVLNELGKQSRALPYLEEVLNYQDAHSSLSQEQRAHETLSDCYAALGEYRLALEHHKQLKTVSDSIYRKDQLAEIASMEAAIKKAELDAEIISLSNDKSIAEMKVGEQRKLVYGSLLSSSLFMVLGLGLFYYYRKAKSQNKEIETALKEKDILLREIHHRVKNNLQIISSVLSLQSRQSRNSSIQQAINEGRNRVRSMALIHQNLYQRENLTGVCVDKYLEKLVQELFHTYNINREVISLELNVQNMDLDVDTMIPLGLVINELVSNSLKHAFAEDEQGSIALSLIEDEGSLVLTVQDSGKGTTEEEIFSSNSFGNRLIKAFSQKLKADFKIVNDNGTRITMTIANYMKAA